MKRRFVIGADSLDAEREGKLRDYLQKKGDWWHWIGDMWLLTTNDQEITVADINNHIVNLKPDIRTVVFEFPEDITWATSGVRNKEGSRISDWLEGPWAKEK
jgi:hypothetical protein